MTTEFTIRILIAALLGGIIGLEREYRAKEAGFRTHFLVALGSSLFMILSQYGFGEALNAVRHASFDPSRIASQVVTGIGFIGAGIIIFQKNAVRGLTTAAGLWVTSAIGLTCGAGLYVLASATAALVLICLEALNVILQRFGTRNVAVTFTATSRDTIKNVLARVRHEGVEVLSYGMRERPDADGMRLEVTLELRVRRKGYEMRMLDMMGEDGDVNVERIE